MPEGSGGSGGGPSPAALAGPDPGSRSRQAAGWQQGTGGRGVLSPSGWPLGGSAFPPRPGAAGGGVRAPREPCCATAGCFNYHRFSLITGEGDLGEV